jgi:hypothetical protein
MMAAWDVASYVLLCCHGRKYDSISRIWIEALVFLTSTVTLGVFFVQIARSGRSLNHWYFYALDGALFSDFNIGELVMLCFLM